MAFKLYAVVGSIWAETLYIYSVHKDSEHNIKFVGIANLEWKDSCLLEAFGGKWRWGYTVQFFQFLLKLYE